MKATQNRRLAPLNRGDDSKEAKKAVEMTMDMSLGMDQKSSAPKSMPHSLKKRMPNQKPPKRLDNSIAGPLGSQLPSLGTTASPMSVSPSDLALPEDVGAEKKDEAMSHRSSHSNLSHHSHNSGTLSNAAAAFDKRSLCIDILVEGHVNSYVDFFYLTHRPEEENNGREIPLDQLPYIKEFLTAAEAAHRSNDSIREYEAYKRLADYFKEVADYKTSIYFYEKCLEISESIDDTQRQCQANLNLGLTHDKLGETLKAIKFHERHLAIAEHVGDDTAKELANRHLMDVYRCYAEEFEKKNDHRQSVLYYKKCLDSATVVDDLKAEGLAHYKLGLAYQKLNDHEQAITFEKNYLGICKQTSDQIGEGAACCALAYSYQETNKMELAIQYLEFFLDIATRNQQLQAQAEACCQLGSIYSKMGHHERAVEFFEKNYEITRSIGDRNLIDAARINLGMARGKLKIGKYMQIVKDDLPALLEWKSKRDVAK
eukprot:TRINITY_DN22686_c0_g1_i1.p1 TRINITY_DN22686_c0_g1~~TRINITY_DN22686_c0_g1_i1.p1  ORF type:complete len:485 (+),score=39.57 TRINITY_DN22686_c0_g1_i1:70-1524(+)